MQLQASVFPLLTVLAHSSHQVSDYMMTYILTLQVWPLSPSLLASTACVTFDFDDAAASRIKRVALSQTDHNLQIFLAPIFVAKVLTILVA